MKVIAEVTFSPLGTETPSLSRYVAAALATLAEQPGVTYQLNPMGTVLEGERSAVWAACEAMNDAISRFKIQPVIDRAFTFEEARDAYAYLNSGQHFGKVVIRI